MKEKSDGSENERQRIEQNLLVHEISHGNWSTRNYNSDINIKDKNFALFF